MELTPANARRICRHVVGWFTENARDLPWRHTLDPYAIWISEIMLQQTQVKTVIPYWNRWMKQLPDVGRLARARESTILKLWEGLGYYSRVRNAQRAAQQIVDTPGGTFPKSTVEILELPGIGRYTTGAIASIAYNESAPILDGNVIRVLTRLLGIDGDPKQKEVNERLWAAAADLVATAGRLRQAPTDTSLKFSGWCSVFNQGLMELGATVCTPKQAKCTVCPLREECHAYAEGNVDQLPNTATRAKTTRRFFGTFVIRNGKEFLVRQRPVGEVNSGFWEFPNVECESADIEPKIALKELMAARVMDLQHLRDIHHSITRYRIQQRIFTGKTKARSAPSGTCWRTAEDLARLPFVSAHRKLFRALGVL
ncbi:MAG: A/G-specific adenine glycosylase [Verrucomicrobiia bacterium]